MKQHLIFDLDGTLIDSAPSILHCFGLAFSSTQTPLAALLTHDVIGPPLMEALKQLAGSDDATLLNALAAAFKQHYDTTGYVQSVVFEDVSAMLQQLKDQGYQLYIATNKRFYPTEKIMAHLGWKAFFSGVYALDYFNPPLKTKAEMIGRVVADNGLTVQDCLYIGDRLEDGVSADANQMAFALVSWGYAGDVAMRKPHWHSCAQVQDLAGLISTL
ncbi:HAD family hydrolase [Methylophilus sp. 5]|uniref:HAD family hydrolase n=1 Tax=Methylophilus sp. 5 TaxID=1112274 RepID=UPI00048E73E4|nr:HAD hydrolase-like protein [Methylophilus sp. 5]